MNQAVARKQSEQKGKCQKKLFISGNKLMRQSTNLWRGCVPILTTKINPLCQCFGVLYVESTRLRYVDSKTSPGLGLVAPVTIK